MSEIIFSGLKLGILGGGQLGLMFSQVAMNYGIELYILDPDAEASCSPYCSRFTQGSLVEEETVYAFGKDLDILTIEIENVNVQALKRLRDEGVRVYPQPEIIELIQDKGLQKKFFTAHQIPTSDFICLSGKEELPAYAAMLPAVMKSRKAGYDGRGVVKIDSPADFDKGFEVPSILEKKVEFSKELSVLVSRNAAGEIETFDVVEMEFNPVANLVEFLIAPARITYLLETAAKELAVRIITDLNMVGLLAVEMFLTHEGTLLINELAPRPHNSGHHTIEANFTSQYEQHLRAVMNMHLGSTRCRSKAVTLNLLGEEGFDGPVVYEGLDLIADMEGVYLHLYGKKISRPLRKMGHITIIADDISVAYLKAEFIKDNIKVKAHQK